MINSKTLSGEELVNATRGSASLPVPGQKVMRPDGSRLEQSEVRVALEGRRLLLRAPRVQRSGALCDAEWGAARGAVLTRRGGGRAGGRRYLQPEEVLLLMELSALSLSAAGVPLSLQAARARLLSDSSGPLSAAHYAGFAALGRLGYRLYRRDPTAGNVHDYETNAPPAHTPDPSTHASPAHAPPAHAPPAHTPDASTHASPAHALLLYPYRNEIKRIKDSSGARKRMKREANLGCECIDGSLEGSWLQRERAPRQPPAGVVFSVCAPHAPRTSPLFSLLSAPARSPVALYVSAREEPPVVWALQDGLDVCLIRTALPVHGQ